MEIQAKLADGKHQHAGGNVRKLRSMFERQPKADAGKPKAQPHHAEHQERPSTAPTLMDAASKNEGRAETSTRQVMPIDLTLPPETPSSTVTGSAGILQTGKPDAGTPLILPCQGKANECLAKPEQQANIMNSTSIFHDVPLWTQLDLTMTTDDSTEDEHVANEPPATKDAATQTVLDTSTTVPYCQRCSALQAAEVNNKAALSSLSSGQHVAAASVALQCPPPQASAKLEACSAEPAVHPLHDRLQGKTYASMLPAQCAPPMHAHLPAVHSCSSTGSWDRSSAIVSPRLLSSGGSSCSEGLSAGPPLKYRNHLASYAYSPLHPSTSLPARYSAGGLSTGNIAASDAVSRHQHAPIMKSCDLTPAIVPRVVGLAGKTGNIPRVTASMRSSSSCRSRGNIAPGQYPCLTTAFAQQWAADEALKNQMQADVTTKHEVKELEDDFQVSPPPRAQACPEEKRIYAHRFAGPGNENQTSTAGSALPWHVAPSASPLSAPAVPKLFPGSGSTRSIGKLSVNSSCHLEAAAQQLQSPFLARGTRKGVSADEDARSHTTHASVTGSTGNTIKGTASGTGDASSAVGIRGRLRRMLSTGA